MSLKTYNCSLNDMFSGMPDVWQHHTKSKLCVCQINLELLREEEFKKQRKSGVACH